MYQLVACQLITITWKEIDMSHMHRIRRFIGVLTGLAAAVVAAVAVAPAAFALEVPPPPGPAGRYEPVAPLTKHPPVPAHTHAAVTIGMPGWQIALIAVGAAVVAAALAVLLDRLWAARRHPTPTHA
jgi:hypothetical protein